MALGKEKIIENRDRPLSYWRVTGFRYLPLKKEAVVEVSGYTDKKSRELVGDVSGRAITKVFKITNLKKEMAEFRQATLAEKRELLDPEKIAYPTDTKLKAVKLEVTVREWVEELNYFDEFDVANWKESAYNGLHRMPLSKKFFENAEDV